MKAKTIYILPETEEYTGYTTYVLVGTSTSDIGSFFQDKQGDVTEYEIKKKKEVEKEYIIPESQEGKFIDKDLSEFYQKKGYDS